MSDYNDTRVRVTHRQERNQGNQEGMIITITTIYKILTKEITLRIYHIDISSLPLPRPVIPRDQRRFPTLCPQARQLVRASVRAEFL